MTSRKRFPILGTTTLLLIGAVSVVIAQTPGTGQGASPMYDVKTETTIKGTVESVETVTGTGGRGRRGLGGTHITVKTEKETLEVHVGPTAYLTEKEITFAKGATYLVGRRVRQSARRSDARSGRRRAPASRTRRTLGERLPCVGEDLRV